jgi:predicted DNA-binding protein
MAIKPKPNTKRVTFHMTYNMADKLEKLAHNRGLTVSEILRNAVNKYMNVDLYTEETEYLTDIIRPLVREEMGKQANRLASMMFKVGIITSANYFLAVRTLSDVISPSMLEDFRDINANARKLGIDYMKQSGVGVVEFLEDTDAVERAADKLKTDLSGR